MKHDVNIAGKKVCNMSWLMAPVVFVCEIGDAKTRMKSDMNSGVKNVMEIV